MHRAAVGTWSVAVALTLLMGSVASAAPEAEPPVLEQGEHRGVVAMGQPTVLAVDLDGDQARAQLRFDVPEGATGLTSTLRWSVATEPAGLCTQNDSLLDGSLEDRTALDSRRTDSPDPDEPCTQPGRHLLNILVADPEGSLPDDATVPYTLVLSTFGGPADVGPTSELTAEESVPFASSPPAELAADPASVPTERRPLGQAVALTVAAVLAVAGATAVIRRRDRDLGVTREEEDLERSDDDPPGKVLEFPRRER